MPSDEPPDREQRRARLRPLEGLVELQATAGAADNMAPPPLRPEVTGVDELVRPHIDLAVADLAGRLEIDASDIEVLVAASVTWPDRSCGCPQPGMVYPQVTVDGAYVVLGVAGRTYPYHSGGSRGPFLCEPAHVVPAEERLVR